MQELNDEKPSETAHDKEVAPAEEGSSEEVGSDLSKQIWSVVAFDGLAASGITYHEAKAKMAQLTGEKVSGLCIITDEAAARMAK